MGLVALGIAAQAQTPTVQTQRTDSIGLDGVPIVQIIQRETLSSQSGKTAQAQTVANINMQGNDAIWDCRDSDFPPVGCDSYSPPVGTASCGWWKYQKIRIVDNASCPPTVPSKFTYWVQDRCDSTHYQSIAVWQPIFWTGKCNKAGYAASVTMNAVSPICQQSAMSMAIGDCGSPSPTPTIPPPPPSPTPDVSPTPLPSPSPTPSPSPSATPCANYISSLFLPGRKFTFVDVNFVIDGAPYTASCTGQVNNTVCDYHTAGYSSPDATRVVNPDNTVTTTYGLVNRHTRYFQCYFGNCSNDISYDDSLVYGVDLDLTGYSPTASGSTVTWVGPYPDNGITITYTYSGECL